jgi:hypothetical protein
MTDQNNKLTVPVKLGVSNAPSFGLKSKLQTAQQSGTTLDNVANAKERIIIVADDSGSMDGVPMQQQKKAIAAFLGVCNPLDTAVGVTPMNRERINLTLVHPLILAKTAGWPDHGGGGTPTFGTLSKALEQNPSRVVLVSDGQPTDGSALKSSTPYNWNNGGEVVESLHHPILDKYKAVAIKIDTVFIGEEYDKNSQAEMKAIAELTGGLYIFFKEGESFAKQFKYLAPAYYAQLTAGTIKL